MTRRSAFLDGNDLCAGCGRCCHDIDGLRLTPEDLERLPAFAPLVTRQDGPYLLADVQGPCPYLAPDRRCGVFEQRPADCGAYPIDVAGPRRRRPDGVLEVQFRYEGGDCPERPELLRRALAADPAPVRQWIEQVEGGPVELVQDPGQVRRIRVLVGLHRTRLLVPLMRALGRLPRRPAPPVS